MAAYCNVSLQEHKIQSLYRSCNGVSNPADVIGAVCLRECPLRKLPLYCLYNILLFIPHHLIIYLLDVSDDDDEWNRPVFTSTPSYKAPITAGNHYGYL